MTGKSPIVFLEREFLLRLWHHSKARGKMEFCLLFASFIFVIVSRGVLTSQSYDITENGDCKLNIYLFSILTRCRFDAELRGEMSQEIQPNFLTQFYSISLFYTTPRAKLTLWASGNLIYPLGTFSGQKLGFGIWYS